MQLDEAERALFAELLCGDGEALADYAELFDDSDATVKRAIFNRQRNTLFAQLVARDGMRCRLRLPDICQGDSDLVVDHLLPLATNEVNKRLGRTAKQPGRKVAAQSVGSNHPHNLALACARCNAFKKHRLLDRERLRALVLENRRNVAEHNDAS